jgi:hypothetical protein
MFLHELVELLFSTARDDHEYVFLDEPFSDGEADTWKFVSLFAEMRDFRSQTRCGTENEYLFVRECHGTQSSNVC